MTYRVQHSAKVVLLGYFHWKRNNTYQKRKEEVADINVIPFFTSSLRLIHAAELYQMLVVHKVQNPSVFAHTEEFFKAVYLFIGVYV